MRETFIQEQDKFAKVVLTGILNELYELKTNKDFEKVEVFAKMPTDAQDNIRVVAKQDMTFHALVDLVSGMTDRYAIAFWKEIAGLSALDRLTSKPFRKVG